MRNFLLLATTLVLIASPRLRKLITPSYADSQPQRTTALLLVRYCLLAISYHCGSAYSVLLVSTYGTQYTRLLNSAMLNYLGWNVDKLLLKILMDFNLNLSSIVL